MIVPEGTSSVFLIFLSRAFTSAVRYMRLIIQLQSLQGVDQVVFFDSLKHFAFKESLSPLQFFPQPALVNVIEHPQTFQYELIQSCSKNILDTVTVLRNNNDRFKFEKPYLL